MSHIGKSLIPWTPILGRLTIVIDDRPEGSFITVHSKGQSKFHTTLLPFDKDSADNMNWYQSFKAIDEEGIFCVVTIGRFHTGNPDEDGKSDYDYFKVTYHNRMWIWAVYKDKSESSQ